MNTLVVNFIKHIGITALLVSSIAACSPSNEKTPEDRIRELLTNIEEQAEARSLSGVMEYVSEEYQDHQGLTKSELARLLQFQIIRNRNINIFTHIKDIKLSDSIATVELSAAMAATKADLSNEKNRLGADTIRFSVLLSDVNGDWLIQSVSWKQGW